MSDAESNSRPPPECVRETVERAEALCRVHDHIARVIEYLDLPMDEFPDQRRKLMPQSFDFEALVRVYLYMETCGYSQRETEDRLRRWPYLQVRFELDRAPTQQSISTFKSRLTRRTRTILTETARGLREVGAEHDVLGAPNRSPPAKASEVCDDGGELTNERIVQAVDIARRNLFTKFATGRAANAKYEDEVFWEIQAYLSMTGHGGRKTKWRSSWLSRRPEMPHKDTHSRAVKMISSPAPQTTLDDFELPRGPEQWMRIRDTLLRPFQRAIETLMEETDFEDQLREPVNVAIDVTPWQFYPSPWKHYELGRPKENFPEMVSGYKGRHERAYKFATLSVVGKDTPFILAIEPVKENSMWEEDSSGTPMEDVVERLIEKASEHVDIHKVMGDSEYDNNAVRDFVDRKGLTYIVPKPSKSQEDIDAIEELEAQPGEPYGVRNDVPLKHDGRVHEVDFIYAPPNQNSSEYRVFTTNADVPLDRAPGIVAQYSDRWTIENEYKEIKAHYLPRTNSSDYRMRLFYFVAAVLMYNTWRLTNVLIRQWFDVNLGEAPPVPAGQIREILFLRKDTGIG